MTEYNPYNWVIIKMKGDDPHYRVLGGWSGGEKGWRSDENRSNNRSLGNSR